MSLSKLNSSLYAWTLDGGEPETSGCATIGDLPPEILTQILEYLLDGKRNTILSYRLINSEWKSIIDSHLENKMVSGVLRPFPEMKLESNLPSIFHADCCPTLFSEGSNPFFFNSLFAQGTEGPGQEWNLAASNQFYEVTNVLQDFGAGLSSFALCNHRLTVPELASMLDWMPCLKRLSLCFVYRPRYYRCDVFFPSPPPLPYLISLELKFDDYYSRAPCYWLVVSYADQLVQLSIEATECPFEPLQKQYQYLDSFNIIVGTTSGAAFGKLKELKICRPSREFLQLSESPVLQHMSVTGIERWRRIGLQDLTKFIEGCSSTLQTLAVDVNWDDWVDRDQEWVDPKPNPTAHKLRSITIHYPKDDINKSNLKGCSLLKFQPGLEVLQIIHFGTEQDVTLMDPNNNELNLEIHSCDEKERAELKQQLASLDKREAALQGELNGVLLRQQEARKARRTAAEAARKGGAYGWPQVAAERRLIIQQWKENAALRHQIDVGLQEKAPLLQRLYVLNRKAAIARELRELGIWSCPKLKVVSVSSGDKVCGDICVIRKMNAVGFP